MKKEVKDYEIIRHGYMHEDSFQGCGTSFTEWDNAYTGIGDCEYDALEDAFDMVAGDYDVDYIYNTESKETFYNDDEIEDDTEDKYQGIHYYVSIRIKG